jgi:hypothetical protein
VGDTGLIPVKGMGEGKRFGQEEPHAAMQFLQRPVQAVVWGL